MDAGITDSFGAGCLNKAPTNQLSNHPSRHANREPATVGALRIKGGTGMGPDLVGCRQANMIVFFVLFFLLENLVQLVVIHVFSVSQSRMKTSLS